MGAFVSVKPLPWRHLKGYEDVVVDTMFWIYLFEDHPKYASLCEKLLDTILSGYFSIQITPITFSELLIKPIEKKKATIADQYRDSLVSLSNTKLSKVDHETGCMAAALKAKYALSLPDAFQCAAALQANKPTLITNDQALAKIKEIEVFLLRDWL